ncbi:hypothetical protein FSB73_03110 [Arachidicoccus ginsenosidivorans]|uniref:Uncharacterized protein n=1 Tax=Arachidicoccus ginsenosidivorans TaxID=496057 RepID=A0A5B8VGT1_9BACT|nr:hypothetical protein [Arachidicoccus ginsenosidivorans]QEC70817.1 hypothetical protein FSB73_03110 [Arachidicoccus ginsenosidivorans]
MQRVIYVNDIDNPCNELPLGADKQKSGAASLEENKSAHLAFPIRISDNHRYFVDQNGHPFFWLGIRGGCYSAN